MSKNAKAHQIMMEVVVFLVGLSKSFYYVVHDF